MSPTSPDSRSSWLNCSWKMRLIWLVTANGEPSPLEYRPEYSRYPVIEVRFSVSLSSIERFAEMPQLSTAAVSGAW